MACSTDSELYMTTDKRALAEEQPLPETLCHMSLLMRVICFLALGRPDLDDHWKSLHSEQAFETVRSKLCSILASTITAASVLLAISGVFVSTGSPVPSFDYTSPAPHCLLFVAHACHDRDVNIWLEYDTLGTHRSALDPRATQARRLLRLVLPVVDSRPHILRCLVPELFHVCDVDSRLLLPKHNLSRRHCALRRLVTYVVNVGTILIDFLWKYAKSLKPR
ncbi:hypothetical protein EDD22DRAFT_887781 [Suillus occidentalis]|nr:hypothetical protein EDD22DRAFT_887781 [Suillus occidentalis]